MDSGEYFMRIPTKKNYSEEVVKDNINELLRNEFVSLTAIQRYFDIGYASAGRVLDEMFSKGLLISENAEVPFKAKFDLSKRQELEEYLFNELKRIKSF